VGLAVAMFKREPVCLLFPREWSAVAQEHNRVVRRIMTRRGSTKVVFDALFQVRTRRSFVSQCALHLRCPTLRSCAAHYWYHLFVRLHIRARSMKLA
jgi:hypothetical protein